MIKLFTMGVSNLYIVQEQETIIVDSGADTSEEQYQQLFREAGIEPQEVKLIVISHGHNDHFQNLYLLKEMTGAPVVCHKNAVDIITKGSHAPVIARTEIGVERLTY